MQRYDVLNIGLVVVDIPIKLPVHLLDFMEDSIRIPSAQMLPGGDAANSSIVLNQLNKSVSLTAAVGNDSFGNYLVAELERQGVDTSRICVKKGVVTGVSFVLINDTGERTCICTRGNNRELTIDDFDFDLLHSGARHLNLSSLFGHPKLEQNGLKELFIQAGEAGLTRSADVGYDKHGQGFSWVQPIIEHVDYFLPSYQQAVQLTGENDPKLQTRFIVNHAGERTVLIKLGQEGCFVHEPGKEYLVPAFNVHAVDTTGAGDTFLAGMISALLDGMDTRHCVRYANAAAAINVQHLGAASPDVTNERILKMLE